MPNLTDAFENSENDHDAPTVTIHYTFSATITANGEDPEHLRSRLHSSFERAIGYGAITGETAAVCDEYSAETNLLSEPAAALTEAEITDWLMDQIAGGSYSVRDLARKVASAALSSEADMRAEFAERMGLEEDSDATRPQTPKG